MTTIIGWDSSGYPVTTHNTAYSHSHSLNLNPYNNLDPRYTAIKEPEMSVTDQIAKERREARERERVEAAYAEFDALLSGAAPGEVWAFEYEAGLFEVLVMNNDERWSITSGPCRVSYEDAVAWLIRHDVNADDLS